MQQSYGHTTIEIWQIKRVQDLAWTHSRFSVLFHSHSQRDVWILPYAIQWRHIAISHNGCCNLTITLFQSTLMQSGYLPVWNAVCLIYSNPDESSRVYVSDVILAITWIRAGTTVNNTGETFPLQFLSVLLSAKNASWIISLWSKRSNFILQLKVQSVERQ